MSNVINQIKTLLGMEVKLAQMDLENGTIIEAEVFEAGASVFIVNVEDTINIIEKNSSDVKKILSI
jgi:hypothetical protein